MKIIFDLRSCGLGPNGGSQTLVRSANTLQDLNHEVYIIDSGKNQHTWTKLKVPHIIPQNNNKIPDANAIIATGYDSVKHTIKLPNRCGKKFHWIRGYETWRMSEKRIINEVLNVDTTKIVNSTELQRMLQKHNTDSYICFPGYDFDEIFPLNRRLPTDEIIFGGLFNSGSKRSGKRTSWILKAIRKIKESHDIQLIMFGVDPGTPNRGIVDLYYHNPTIVEKNDLYNHTHVFLAPTNSDGLHITPAEAMMTEACVIGTNAPLAGMCDYLFDGKTGIVADNHFNGFIRKIRYIIDNPELISKYGKAGRERILEIGDRKKNMLKLIEILQQ